MELAEAFDFSLSNTLLCKPPFEKHLTGERFDLIVPGGTDRQPQWSPVRQPSVVCYSSPSGVPL